MKGKAKVGIIGAGMGSCHLRSFAKIPDEVEVTAVCDTDNKRLDAVCDEHRILNRFTDYKKMLKEAEMDIMIVATPNYLHAPMTIDCLRAGKDVLVEKPPADNVEGAEAILKAVRETRKKCMYALNNRFREDSQMLKRLIDGGEFGKIYFAKAGWIRRKGIPSGWFCDKKRAGGGALIDLGVHILDLIWWYMGMPKATTVSGVAYDNFMKKTGQRNASVEDYAAALIRFEDDKSMFVEASWASYIEREKASAELLGTKSGIDLDLFPGRESKVFKMYTEKSDSWFNITFPQYDQTDFFDYTQMLRNQILYFIGCVRNDKENIANAEEGVELMKMLIGVYESAEKKKEVVLNKR